MKTILNEQQLGITIQRLAHQLLENHLDLENTVLIGIQPRGIYFSNRIVAHLKAEVDPEVWATLHSDTSRPFDKPTKGRIAVKVINHLGDEVMKVFRL